MDRGREEEGVGLRLPPAGGDSFLGPNGSQINEILMYIIIFIYIIIIIFISKSGSRSVTSRGRFGSLGARSGRSEQGRVGFGLLFLLSRTVSTWVTLFPDWVVVTHLYDHAVLYPPQL